MELVERFIPDGVREAGTDAVLHARLVILCAVTVSVWGPLYLALYVVLDAPELAKWAIAVATLGIAATPPLLRASASPVLAGNWLTLLLFCTVALVALTSGGYWTPAFSWSIGLPVLGLALAGWRSMKWWLAATIVMQASFYGLHLAGSPLSVPFAIQDVARLRFAAFAGLTLMLLITTWIYAKQAKAALEDTNERLLNEMQEHRQTHSRLEQAEQLEALGRVVAGVGHEINNPLSYLLANLEMLESELDGIGDRLDEDTRQRLYALLHDARAGGDGIQDAVQDISVFSRRRRDDTVVPVDVTEVLQQSLRLARNEVRHRARIVEDVHAVPKVQANQAGLGRVLVNLLLNAADAIPVGRSSEDEVRISVYPEGSEEVVIAVSDTGYGMEEEQLSRIFQPFYTTKESGRGTGLGLAICHELVQGFGGRIEVRSRPGKGTTFFVHLHAAQRAVLREKSRSEKKDDRSAVTENADRYNLQSVARVLVIDDDAGLLRTIRRALQRHEVHTAQTGEEAKQACGSRDFHVVLCDVMMPDVSGIELYGELCERHPRLEPRFLFITGGAIGDEAAEFCERMGDRVISKPFSMPDLRERVAKVHASVTGIRRRNRASGPLQVPETGAPQQ